MTPVVVEVALNGVTTKAQNPHVPRTPDEIAPEALRCLEAGAAIVHNHIDDFSLGGAEAAERYLAGWRPVLRARPDAIVYPTVAIGGTVEARFAHVPPLADSGLVHMGVFDPGSVNLGGADADGLPGGFDVVYTNSFGDIRYVADQLAEHRLGPSVSIFEPGFLRARSSSSTSAATTGISAGATPAASGCGRRAPRWTRTSRCWTAAGSPGPSP